MLPNVQSQYRHQFIINGIILVGRAGNDQSTVSIHTQPGPSAAKARHGGLSELLFEAFKRSECGVDSFSQLSLWLSASIRAHAWPEHGMIDMSSAVVAHSSANFFRNGIQICDQFQGGFVLQFIIAFEGFVQIVYVSTMMFIVMDCHGAGVNVGFQGAKIIGQIG